MVDNKIKIKSNPAGKGDKINIDVISLVQIVDKENNKKAIKTVVTNSAKVTGILSTDLDLGVTIKAENGSVRPTQDLTK